MEKKNGYGFEEARRQSRDHTNHRAVKEGIFLPILSSKRAGEKSLEGKLKERESRETEVQSSPANKINVITSAECPSRGVRCTIH